MSKINAQINKLRRLQRRVEKQRKLIDRLTALNSQKLSRKTPKQVQDAGSAVKHVPFTKKVLKKIFIAVVGIGLVAGGCTLLARTVKNKKKNVDDITRYDVLYGEKDAQENERFDLDQASLEELENALLKVENELNEVNAALEQKSNPTT